MKFTALEIGLAVTSFVMLFTASLIFLALLGF